jgi:hypothetical protein
VNGDRYPAIAAVTEAARRIRQDIKSY